MAVTRFTEEYVTPISPARMFKAMILDYHNLVPKISPGVTIEFVEGDGGAGSIMQTKIAIGEHLKCVKHRIDAIDVMKCTSKYTLLEGDDVLDKVESISYESSFEASSNGGCVCKTTMEYHAKEGVELDEDMKTRKDKTIGLFMVLEDYLSANPDVYAK